MLGKPFGRQPKTNNSYLGDSNGIQRNNQLLISLIQLQTSPEYLENGVNLPSVRRHCCAHIIPITFRSTATPIKDILLPRTCYSFICEHHANADITLPIKVHYNQLMKIAIELYQKQQPFSNAITCAATISIILSLILYYNSILQYRYLIIRCHAFVLTRHSFRLDIVYR